MRALLGGIAALALAVQLVADGLYGVVAAPASLPHALVGSWPFALLSTLGLDRLAAVRVELARASLLRDDGAAVDRALAGLPDSATVADLRGRRRLAAGDVAGALDAFARAGDYVAARGAINALAERDPLAALPLIEAFDRRLDAAAAPEIQAEVEWRAGQIAAAVAYTHPPLAATYDRLSLADYQRALQRAPNEETYLLAFGYQSLVVGRAAESVAAYRRAADVDPASTDAWLGLGAASAVSGDCAGARAAFARVHALTHGDTTAYGRSLQGYRPPTHRALDACLR